METIDRLDRECFELRGSIESLENVLTKIVSTSFPKFNMDVDFICLKRSISPENRFEINRLPLLAQKEYIRTGKVTSIQELHKNLLTILNVEEDEKINYPIEITINFLKEKYADLRELSVIPEILNKK